LVDVFVDQVRDGQVLVGRGQCVEQFGEGEAYLPLLDALSGLGRGPDGHHVRAVLRSAAPTWLLQLPGLNEPAELEALRMRTAGASSQRMLRELGDALETLTADRPLVLVCEDLHQSDRPTTELLAYLARRRESARLLMLCTYRPAEVVSRSHPLRQVVQDLRAHGQCGFLPLELLARSAVAAYLTQRLAPRRASDTLIADVHRRTDGNALFMATVVDYLIDRGLLDDVRGEARSRERLDRLGIPESVGQFIEWQLDEHDVADRRLLEIAAAVGVDFSAEAVLAAARQDRPPLEATEIEDRCAALARNAGPLIERDLGEWPDGTLTAQYRFRHALYQEVLYGHLPLTRRVTIHRRIGERLAAGYGAVAADIAAELAMHFERGRDFEQAIPFLSHAAETALRRAAHREALDYASRGLALLARTDGLADRPAVELELRMMQTVALVTLHGAGAPGVDAAYAQARAVCTEIDDATMLAPVLYGLWSFAFNRGRTLDAVELSEELRGLALREPEAVLEMQASSTAGYNLAQAGRPALALPHLERALALYEPAEHRQLALVYGEDPGVGCHQWAAYTTWLMGYPDRARHHAGEARRLAQELGYPNDIAQATWFATAVHVFCRDLDRVRELSDELIEVCQQYDLTRWSALAKVVDGWAAAQGDDQREVVAQMREGLAEYAGTSGFPYFSSSLFAETLARRGDIAAALATASGALDNARRTGELWYESELVRLRGELLLSAEPSRSTDLVHEAERAFIEARDIATRQEARSFELRAVTSLARLWQSRGQPQEFRSVLAGTYGWFTEGHDTHDLQAAAALLAELS
jgi:predicted ATPase